MSCLRCCAGAPWTPPLLSLPARGGGRRRPLGLHVLLWTTVSQLRTGHSGTVLQCGPGGRCPRPSALRCCGRGGGREVPPLSRRPRRVPTDPLLRYRPRRRLRCRSLTPRKPPCRALCWEPNQRLRRPQRMLRFRTRRTQPITLRRSSTSDNRSSDTRAPTGLGNSVKSLCARPRFGTSSWDAPRFCRRSFLHVFRSRVNLPLRTSRNWPRKGVYTRMIAALPS